MKRIYRGRTRALANIVLLGLAWWSAPAARADFNVLPPHSVVEGRTIGEWTAEWWKWAFAQSPPHDAFTDQTGANATLNQSGPVFFLAGTLGGMAERAFEVPADRFILLPLVNVSWSQAELGTDKDEAFLRARAAQDIDLVDSRSTGPK